RLLEFAREGGWMRVGSLGGARREGWIRLEEVGEGEPFGALPEPVPKLPEPETVQLEISGTPGLDIRVTCESIEDGRTNNFEREVRVGNRRTYSYPGEALSCRLKKLDPFGRLRGRVLRNGRQVSAAETAAAFNYIDVRTDGPWGEAWGRRGQVGIVKPNASDANRPIPLLPFKRRESIRIPQ
ncbi:MAG: hypothetical protein R3245_10595, partial [Kiloniellales bacterium]|nr:hypothetical protein [Kiloniellales bacterium]